MAVRTSDFGPCTVRVRRKQCGAYSGVPVAREYSRAANVKPSILKFHFFFFFCTERVLFMQIFFFGILNLGDLRRFWNVKIINNMSHMINNGIKKFL